MPYMNYHKRYRSSYWQLGWRRGSVCQHRSCRCRQYRTYHNEQLYIDCKLSLVLRMFGQLLPAIRSHTGHKNHRLDKDHSHSCTWHIGQHYSCRNLDYMLYIWILIQLMCRFCSWLQHISHTWIMCWGGTHPYKSDICLSQDKSCK